MEKPLSIITINRNNAEGLGRTIESVTSQDSKEFEYIVIDGDSTDGSKETIARNADRIDCWVSEKDGGIYNAMNKGIAKATGEYCLFINSGDTLHDSHVVSQVLPFLLSGSADYYTGSTMYLKKLGRELQPAPPLVTARLLINSAINHPATFIRTSLLKESPYDERYHIVSDWIQMFRALVLDNASYHPLPFIISDFDTTGISMKNEIVRDVERNVALFEMLLCLPPRLQELLCREDVSEEEQKRLQKIDRCLIIGGRKGYWKLLRNAFKWWLCELF